jgi:dihydrofolate reductase
MGKIVVSEFVSLDGVMEDPGGAEGTPFGGWAFKFDRGPDGDRYKLEELMDAEAMLLGRVTYEGFAQAWPGRDDEQGFAARMNGMPKYVVSSTIENPSWENTTVVRGDAAAEVAELRDKVDGNILVAGSTSLVHALHDAGLVDEYRLMIYPAVLGGGKRLFREGASAAAFEPVEVRGSAQVALVTLRQQSEGGAAAA